MVSLDEQVAPPPPISIEQTAERHAAAHRVERRRGRAGDLRARVADLDRTLRDAYRSLTSAPSSPAARSHAAEWLLDNRHVVLEALRQTAENLPRGYYRELPKLAGGSLPGRARVHAVARGILSACEGQVDPERAARYVAAYQRTAPLSMGELWALPTLLRLTVLEGLAEAAAELSGLDGRARSGRGSPRGADGLPSERADAPPAGVGVEEAAAEAAPASRPGGQDGSRPAAGSGPSGAPLLEDPTRVSLAIVGLRAIAAEDWRSFFEAVSRVEEGLRRDPAGVYPRMEFATRDEYRKAVERAAREIRQSGGVGEEAVAWAAIELARSAGRDDGRRRHVGYYLLDEGRRDLEGLLEARISPAAALRRWARRRAVPLYLGAVALAACGLLWAISFAGAAAARSAQAVALILLAGVPAVTVAVSLVNWVATHTLRPKLLPKLDLEDGIPAELRTIVVVPCVLSSANEVRSLLERLEVNHLANAGPNLLFALLSDLPDAPYQHLPTDATLVEEARAGVRQLNARHGGPDAPPPFHLFHRERRWNPGEGCWMGWERKRGKLEEFNRLLAGAADTSFRVREGDDGALRSVRYVLTIDADTFLPPTSAARLVATLAHPLNRAEFDSEGRVAAGYTVLQPRLETVPGSAHRTLFSTVFEPDAGLDLYTHAVSDVYQDLAGEGVFAGKGIYDPPAFERAQAGRVPENALLSHDLFEGIHGRAGLVSDVAVFEQFPAHVLTYMRRLHRWVRGDWQLLPWLSRRVPGVSGRLPNPLSALDRWKIVDNLRRSLVAPTLVLLALAGWLWLPGPPWVWTAVVAGVLGTPIFLQGAATVNRVVRASRQRSPIGVTSEPPALWQGLRTLGGNLWRWFLAIAFLPFEAAVAADAIGRTLFRLVVTRKRLLEWTTAAHSARSLGSRTPASLVWRKMVSAPVLGAATLAGTAGLRPEALPAAAPLAIVWLVAPWIAHRVSRLVRPRAEELSAADRGQLRLLARRTWLFFQHFLGPADHWLPPDNYQEEPGQVVARRTSPTNVGFALLSALAAYDLGYVGALTLAATVRSTLESLQRLERYRGHFLNWYETRTLAPLVPRYVSMVDSGNLAAALLALARGCLDLARAPALRPAQARGFLDTLSVLEELVRAFDARGVRAGAQAVLARSGAMRRRLEDAIAGGSSHALARTAAALLEEDLPELEEAVVTLAETAPVEQDPFSLRELRIWTTAVRQDLQLLVREVELLAPWLLFLAKPPALYELPGFHAAGEWRALQAVLRDRPILGHVPKICRRARRRLAQLDARLGDGSPAETLLAEAREWNERLAGGLEEGRQAAEHLLAGLREAAGRCEPLVEAMDFSFLYDRRRGLFHIGYDVTAGHDDPNYYDLLASEARLASFVAIAKGDVPPGHWLHLGRPFARVDGRRTLLSWGGTMFEYLMPALLMETPEHALLAQSCRAAVRRQIEYGASRGAPWGMSESGFHELDPRGNYQYRAFGAPGLGLKRELGDRLVIAPYASLLALSLEPREVGRNVERLTGLGMLGRYGLFEAVDFGRGGWSGGRVVRSYMAHHQGMILLSLANHLTGGRMVGRFHAQPRVATVEYLLHEQVPWHVPLERPLAVAGDGRRRAPALDRPEPLVSWRPPASAIPQAQALSNGRHTVLITAAGAGESRWKGLALTRWRCDATREAWGTWLYVQDLETGAVWSAARQPVPAGGDEDLLFAPHAAEFQHRRSGVALRVEVTVPPGDDLEIRRVRIVNETGQPRRLAVTSYGEVVLAPRAEDRRHPAFNKLFVESDHLEGRDALIFHRRPRSAIDRPAHLLHAVVGGREARLGLSWETDRRRFIGRGGTEARPLALEPPAPGASGSAAAAGDRAIRAALRGKGRASATRPRPGALSGTIGATLDPVFALRVELELDPSGEVELAFLTMAGDSRADVVARLDGYRSSARIEWAFQQARTRAELDLHELGIPPARASLMQELLTALLHPFHALRAPAETLTANALSRSGLWAYGISGDLPILLVRIGELEGMTVVRELLEAHAWWRTHGVEIDLLILDLESGGYARPVRERLGEVIVGTGGSAWIDQRGGIFVLADRGMDPAARALMECAAAVVLDADGAPLHAQVARLGERPVELPEFVPLPSAPFEREPTSALELPAGLLFDNGWGGFTPDGAEYVIRAATGRPTPAPWSNVVAQPEIGFLVTESGGGFTWAAHSAENRLTPWCNDPVADEPGEALYLRDEETAEIWSPTPGPAGARERSPEGEPGTAGGPEDERPPYVVRHGQGYTLFEHNRNGLEHRLALFVAMDEPVKIARLSLSNAWNRQRRITVTYYAEWVLGESREDAAPHVVPEFDREAGALLARNPFNESFGERVAFLASSEPPHGMTADRYEFLGARGDRARPAALERIGLSGNVRPGLDPCAALQVHVDLAPGQTRELHFLLGQGRDREHALALVGRYRDPGAVESAWREARGFWDRILGAVAVRTPDPAFDLILNRWLPYQILSCRIWGRSALYQSSGAFGFRDQLQDAAALVHADPALARAHLLEAARHQFEEGDVLHWWHPPGGEGVRTRCSDDLLWLPFVTATYVEATGDKTILEESVPFLRGEPLAPDEHDRYTRFEQAPAGGTLYEHCRRALRRGSTRGRHGLPLIGSGDWNDGLNRVGVEGRGESVWLAWFLRATLLAFAPLAERWGDMTSALLLQAQADELLAAAERNAWDGAWYRRAYYDDGAPLGSSTNREARLDSLAQSWAVLAGGDPARARRAMEAVLSQLVWNSQTRRRARQAAELGLLTIGFADGSPGIGSGSAGSHSGSAEAEPHAAAAEPGLVCLFWPPFDRTHRDPGYIKGYPPGVRENGGQYSHAAAWVGWAFAEMGEGDRAYGVFRALNPICRSASTEAAEIYAVEPYVTAADVYSFPPHLARGGWTWYTGSAGWTYRLGLEGILGIRRKGAALDLRPCVPPEWKAWEVTYRYGASRWRIRFENPGGASGGVESIAVDGRPLEGSVVPLADDGREHEVSVRLGRADTGAERRR